MSTTNVSKVNSVSVISVTALVTVLAFSVFVGVARADDGGQTIDWGSDAGQSADWGYGGGQTVDYGQQIDWGQPVDNGQQIDWGQQIDYGQQIDWGQQIDYGQQIDWGQPIEGCGCDQIYEDGVAYTNQDYGYSSGGSYGGSSFGGGSQPFSFSAPHSSYSNPVYSAPIQQQQQQQQQQTRTISAPGNTTTTNNTCTNNSCNSNSTVTISNSGNTSNVTTVTPVRSGSTQYAVQYVYPQTYSYPNFYQYQTYNTVSCYISSSQNYISWAASGATSAWLSGVGSVSPTGSMAVPSTGGTYTLTVSGPGGSNTCSTYVSGVNYNTSVSLSQIPYTGFDFGPVGNALYWLSLLAFAAAGAYLLVYYKGGMALVANGLLARTTSVATAPARIVKHTAQKIEKAIARESSALANLPVMPSVLATVDSMLVAHSKDGSAPRIIITRS